MGISIIGMLSTGHSAPNGCTLVTEGWVMSRWGWIVWKLANTVCVRPAREGGRWTFEEVLNRYVYLSVILSYSLKQCGRYKREINQFQHPANPPDPRVGRKSCLRHGPLRLRNQLAS